MTADADFGDIVEPESLPGAENMARDEAMLEAAADGKPGARLYRWSEPTLSLGYFQRERPAEPRWASLPSVRRLSGGGAILHDREWTYAVALPPTHRAVRRPTELYDRVHDLIRGAFAAIGVPLRRRGTSPDEGDEPFLCFERGDERDLVVSSPDVGDDRVTKIVGSAQRRRRGAVLQHGSVLVGRSPYASELPGVVDLFPVGEAEVATAIDRFADGLARLSRE